MSDCTSQSGPNSSTRSPTATLQETISTSLSPSPVWARGMGTIFVLLWEGLASGRERAASAAKERRRWRSRLERGGGGGGDEKAPLLLPLSRQTRFFVIVGKALALSFPPVGEEPRVEAASPPTPGCRCSEEAPSPAAHARAREGSHERRNDDDDAPRCLMAATRRNIVVKKKGFPLSSTFASSLSLSTAATCVE